MNILVALPQLYCLLSYTANAVQKTEDQQGRTANAIHSALRSHPSIDRPPAFPGSQYDVIDGALSAPDLRGPDHIRSTYEPSEEVPRGPVLNPRIFEGVPPGDEPTDIGTSTDFITSDVDAVRNAQLSRISPRSTNYPTHPNWKNPYSTPDDKRDQVSDSKKNEIKEAINRILSKLISESYISPQSSSDVRPDGRSSQKIGENSARSLKPLQRMATKDDIYKQAELAWLQSQMGVEGEDTEGSGSWVPHKLTNLLTNLSQKEKKTV